MKYMGSKRQMLQNGLGKLLLHKATDAKRVVDLFSGSAAVSWFVAENIKRPVLAVDLQHFSAVLAGSIITRTKIIKPDLFAKEWIVSARHNLWESPFCYEAFTLDHANMEIEQLARRAKKLCAACTTPITAAYGGYYYSPMQALALDSLRKHLCSDEPYRSICLAGLIAAASKCAAAPGHTAQPLSPSPTSAGSIRESWKKDPFALAYREVVSICSRAARTLGSAVVADALDIAATLNKDDLVFVDPPYSGVQYSRFYHVLETLALWKTVEVTGTGRYPPLAHRPQSKFSNKGESGQALRKLLETLAQSKSTILLTFPNTECSNGLSGDVVQDMASEYFTVNSKLVIGRFSTLGGNNTVRKSRLKSEELILTLKPKTTRSQKVGMTIRANPL